MLHSPSDLDDAPPESTHLRTAHEISDLIMSSDGEASNVYPPPPHIAARFYRHTNTRRKSSATSSRRNSLSSLHSNLSNRSCHGGPQSTHIAQHLRRASIIENRKARLADKAAHAEKVRLRAALAKAAPRMSTYSEERVMAAQQARERYLAQVAANCAEEVKRAKKVAEDMKEKKAAEHLKLKGGMEERFAEAERRRLLYQQNLRRTRTTGLPPVEEKRVAFNTWEPKTDEAAARLIQKAWRNRKRRQVVAEYLELGLTVERIQKASFEDVSILLSQEKVLANTAKLLKLCGLQDGEGGGLGESTAARSFLSAFLILGHPSQVFNSDGEQEQDLLRKAEDLLGVFNCLVSKVAVPDNAYPLSVQLDGMSQAFSVFRTAFTAWKNHDSSILLETMVAQFVELEAIWQTVKNDTDGDVAADYKVGIQHNQTLLLVRIKRLVGPERARKTIMEAVRANRKLKPRKPSLGGARPRASNTSQPSSNAVDGTSGHARAHPQGTSASNRSLQSIELSKTMVPLPDNRTLMHELAINREYRIDVDQKTELRDTVNRAVFSIMRSDLEAGLGDTWIVSMSENIRDRLLRVLTPGKPFHNLISETLDPKMIESQLKIGSFSYEKFFSFMNSILPKMCAPVRDPEVKALAADDSGDLIERLAKLMHVLDLLSLDHANYLLQNSASELIRRHAEYEQQCFAAQNEGRRLLKTLRWWSRARVKTIAETTTRRAGDGAHQPTPVRVAPDRIYTQGLVDLAILPHSLHDIDIPETLGLDKARITHLRDTTLGIIMIGAVLLTAKNLLKRDVRSQWKLEAQRMWELSFGKVLNPSTDSSATISAAYLSVISTSHTLPPTTRTTLLGTIERIISDARSEKALDHPVMKVLWKKLHAHVFETLVAGSAEQRLKATMTASEVLARSGLPEFAGRVSEMVDELRNVKRVDWEGHGAWLDEVAREVEASAAV
ncbi:hypothetical protein MMC24_004825 [Lignoscripta atroalba]|nr:hypothetical protein [Lignoscripta atroalba]